MNDDYFDVIEELHSGDTANLSGVVEEVNRINGKKKNKNSIFSSLFKSHKKEVFKKNVQPSSHDGLFNKNSDITCRVLFISVLDKILLLGYIVAFVVVSFLNFKGDMASLSYNFLLKIIDEALIVVVFIILYYLINWIYKCANKTFLTVNEKQIYRECYFPLKKSVTTIPINRVSSVKALNVFGIFRAVVILSNNGYFPLIFFTWNNQQFKDRVDELVIGEKRKVKNKYDDKDLLDKNQFKYVVILGLVFVLIIGILGIVRLTLYLTSETRKIVGVYNYGENYFDLKDNGTCNVNLNYDNVNKCTWGYNKDNKLVEIELTLKDNGYDYNYDYEDLTNTQDSNEEIIQVITAAYSKGNLIYNDIEFVKK